MKTKPRRAPARVIHLKQKPPSLADLIRQGVEARNARQHDRAEELLRRATRLHPGAADGWGELGCLLLDLERYREAVECFRQTAQIVQAPIGQPDQDACREGARLLSLIVAANPRWVRGQLSLGCVLHILHELEQARPHLEAALALDPAVEPSARLLLADIARAAGKWSEGIAAANRVLELDSSRAQAYMIRSSCYDGLGSASESVDSLRRGLALQPDAELHACMLFRMNWAMETTAEMLYDEARRWYSLYGAPRAGEAPSHVNSRDPERRLRVGYVSPDIYNHAMAKYISPVLDNHDRSLFEPVLYSIGDHTDETTAFIRNRLERFVEFKGSGAELAERVRADQIDILVDLAGYTMHWEKLLAFARKPAPVQVSWLGYPSTTGFPTMDYFFGTEHTPPPGIEHLFTETIYRLPGTSWTYRPIADVPVVPSPCLTRGRITFGVFNNPMKISREMVRLWSSILRDVPGSRLLMKYSGLERPDTQQRFLRYFAEDGIAPERIEFQAAGLPVDYLRSFGEIDIALDTFPHNGSTTTLDTLWMGVPVVSLTGELPAQSVGATILRTLGLPEMVANTPEEYRKAVLFLVEIVPHIPDIRLNVRKAVMNSPFMKPVVLTRNVERAFREMWRHWCRTGERIPPGPNVGLAPVRSE